ncbi:MAG: TraX family protein [Oscillospiraceae bacterium]
MTTFILKMVALISMTLDHLRQFNPDFPIWFSWVGRIAAPIFLFCTVQAFIHTKNRKKLLLRLYLANVVMGITDFCLGVSNNFIGALFVLTTILWIIEILKNNKKKGFLLLSIFILYQLVITVICYYTPFIIDSDSNVYLFASIFIVLLAFEGGFATLYVLLGVIIYLCNDNKIKLAVGYSAFCVVYFIITTTNIVLRVTSQLYTMNFEKASDIVEIACQLLCIGPMDTGGNFLTENYNWMMIFALPFILAYNKRKGKDCKWLFYIYYPLHIILFSLIF